MFLIFVLISFALIFVWCFFNIEWEKIKYNICCCNHIPVTPPWYSIDISEICLAYSSICVNATQYIKRAVSILSFLSKVLVKRRNRWSHSLSSCISWYQMVCHQAPGYVIFLQHLFSLVIVSETVKGLGRNSSLFFRYYCAVDLRLPTLMHFLLFPYKFYNEPFS